MLGYGENIETIDPCFAHAVFGGNVSVGVHSVAVKVGLEHLVAINLG